MFLVDLEMIAKMINSLLLSRVSSEGENKFLSKSEWNWVEKICKTQDSLLNWLQNGKVL